MKKGKLHVQPKADDFINNGTPNETAGYEPFDDAVQALQATDTEMINEDLEDEETGTDFILPESYHIQEDPFMESPDEETPGIKPSQTPKPKEVTKKPL